MVIWAYFLAGILAFPLVIMIIFIRALSQPAYRHRLHERLGWFSAEKTSSILIHGASVGEIRTLKPFIESLLEQHPEIPLTLTSFTPTGSEQVKNLFHNRVQHSFLPLDILPCVWLFISRLKPKALVLMETEIWPCLIYICHKKGIPVFLINGRISPRSYPKYQKISRLIAPTLQKVEKVLGQSKEDTARFVSLGLPEERATTSGNIKYDLRLPESLIQQSKSIALQLEKRPAWVVGSTHEDEEKLILDAFDHVRKVFPETLLVIVPRHPERFSAVENRVIEQGCAIEKRSSGRIPTSKHQVWLIDTMGELLLFYGAASVCTVCGSFGKTGGHNPIEPALFSKPVIVGTNMRNFAEITEALRNEKGILEVEPVSKNLAQAVLDLLHHPNKGEQMGRNAHKVVKENQGATQASVATLLTHLNLHHG